MTVCVAATCEKGQVVIAAADRMVTSGLMIEFEHPSSKKITDISTRCVALTAGDALAHTELFAAVQGRLHELADPSVEQVVEAIKEIYQELRRGRIEDLFLKPRGFGGFPDFYRHHGQISESIVLTIQSEIDRFDYGLQILVCGLSGRRAHIYVVGDPGTSACFDSINFHVIGSGTPHAVSKLITSRCSQDLPLEDALLLVHQAKRVAEIAPGVGSATDIAIVVRTGIIQIPEEKIGVLDELVKIRQSGNIDWRPQTRSFLESLQAEETKDSPPEAETGGE